MRLIDLYPPDKQVSPCFEAPGWAVNTYRTPVFKTVQRGKQQVQKEVGVTGDGCTMCNRHKKRTTGEAIYKGLLKRGTNPAAGRLLCVFSYQSFGHSVDETVKMIRASGFEGDILVELPLKCGTGDPTEVQIAACRPYLRTTFERFKPDRVFLFGALAAKAVTGVAIPSWSNRWCWTLLPLGEPGPEQSYIPAVSFFDPVKAASSLVHREIFKAELRWGLETKFPTARPEGIGLLLENDEDATFAQRWFDTVEANAGWFLYDVETDGIQWTEGFKIISLAVAAPGMPTALVWDEEALANPVLFAVLRRALESRTLRKRAINEKYDGLSVRCAWKFRVNAVDGDGRLENKLANADSSASLENMGFYVGTFVHKAEAKRFMKDALKLAQTDLEDACAEAGVELQGTSKHAFAYKHLPLEVLLRYNALDVVTSVDVCEYARASLGPLEATLHRLILPANELFKDIEEFGMLVNAENVFTAQTFLQMQVEAYAPVFARNGIDPDKPESIRQWLDRMGIESPIQTATGLASTSAKALTQIKKGLVGPENEVIASLLEYRKLAKLLSGYANNLLGFVRSDGRVHPSFLLDGARSGRQSCTQPALQTIPSKGDLAPIIKSCFVARPGYKLVIFDFAILEIRVSAILSEDPDMLEAACKDFHTETAKSIAQLAWGMTPEAVEAEIKSGNKKKRDAAKTLGFAILYGAGPESIAEKVGCSVEAAKVLIAAFLAKYKRLKAWMREQEDFARANGYIEIPWLDGTLGRVRPLLDIHNVDRKVSGNAKRAAVNSPIQSVASDICLTSAVRINQYYKDNNIPANVVCLVHDSIISEVRDDYVDEVCRVKARIMCDHPTKGVPLVVEGEVGQNWGNVKKVDLHALAA